MQFSVCWLWGCKKHLVPYIFKSSPPCFAAFYTDIPQRLDRLPWSSWHLFVSVTLGFTCVLNGLAQAPSTLPWLIVSTEARYEMAVITSPLFFFRFFVSPLSIHSQVKQKNKRRQQTHFFNQKCKQHSAVIGFSLYPPPPWRPTIELIPKFLAQFGIHAVPVSRDSDISSF